MSRTFAGGSSQYAEVDSAVVTTYPLTLAARFRPTLASGAQAILWVGDKDVTDQWHALYFDGGLLNASYTCRQGSTATASTANSSCAINTWHSAVAVGASATDRKCYLDALAAVSETTNLTPAGVDRTTIGRYGDSTPGNYFTGDIALIAVWNVALTAAEAAAFNKGVSPYLIRPLALVEVRVLGLSTTERSYSRGGAGAMTLFNAPAVGPRAPGATLFGRGAYAGATISAASGGGSSILGGGFAVRRRRRLAA
jgi:hypothetical protein